MDLPQIWAIVDVLTGRPGVIRQEMMVGMSPREAEDMVVQMNVGDIRRGRSARVERSGVGQGPQHQNKKDSRESEPEAKDTGGLRPQDFRERARRRPVVLRVFRQQE
ncbi:hypothetical protein FJV80_27600 [Mesorhizobium sp. WSM4310]|nr:hypothetical protein FJV80_27600 [Mesorhizobium sp. WSM4310]